VEGLSVLTPWSSEFVERLAEARIGATFNFYREGERAVLLRARLARYLEERANAPLLLVAEAPGYRGTRVSGVPLTSERQLTGTGPAEATATIVHRVLRELGLDDVVLLWNLVPTHPERHGLPASNRAPTREEVAVSSFFLDALAHGRRVVPVGRLAHGALGGRYVRHPSHGGAAAFRSGLLEYARAERRRAP
jgi:uracil-DNA glycosylase